MLALAAVAATLAAQQRVAVIGGGFAGTSTAYYLNKLCPDCYDVTIYESYGRLGGRVGHIQIPGTDLIVNVGGDAYSVVNEYVMQLQTELNITPDPDKDSAPTKSIGLWEGKGRGWEPLPIVGSRLPWDVVIGLVEISRIRETLKKNYEVRGDLATGSPFESVAEFSAAGGLDAFTNMSMKSLMDKLGVGEKFQQGLLEPMTRDIYDQPLGLNAFAGMATILSGASSTYSALGGNDQFPQHLAKASGAEVRLGSPVTAVDLVNDKFTVTTSTSSEEGYDWVVLAAPLEAPDAAKIKWSGFELPAVPPRQYRHWYVLWVVAEAPNPEYFEKDSKVPDLILTREDSSAAFVKLGTENYVNGTNNTVKAFKIFTNQAISDADLGQIFTGLRWSHTTHWPYTFPDLSPGREYPPVRLHERVLYPNAMESMAVAMETAVIGGRNAAQQIHQATKKKL